MRRPRRLINASESTRSAIGAGSLTAFTLLNETATKPDASAFPAIS